MPRRIASGLHFCYLTSNVPTFIICGLYLLDKQRRMRRHWSRSNRQHAEVHAVQNRKSEKRYSCIIAHSFIFHPLFSIFPFHIVLLSISLHLRSVRYRNIFYLFKYVPYDYFHMFRSNFEHFHIFQRLLIFKNYFHRLVFFTSHFKN